MHMQFFEQSSKQKIKFFFPAFFEMSFWLILCVMCCHIGRLKIPAKPIKDSSSSSILMLVNVHECVAPPRE